MSILLVEDEQDVREVLVEHLAEKGYSVVAARNGVEAIQYLTNTPTLPRLILMDLVMPVMDGWVLKRKLEASDNWKNIPCIVYATDPRQAPIHAVAVIERPISLDELMNSIDSEVNKLGLKP